MHEEPERAGFEQLHSSPTDEESGQAKPSESTSSRDVWDDVSGDAPASKVAGTEGHEVEESVDGDI